MASESNQNDLLEQSSFLYGGNANYIEQLYAQYEENPQSLDSAWQEFFASLNDKKADVLKNAKGASWQRANWPLAPSDTLTAALDGDWSKVEALLTKKLKNTTPAAASATALQDSINAMRLIDAYRRYGHFQAKIDPLELQTNRGNLDELNITAYGFSAADLEKEIFVDGAFGAEKIKVGALLNILTQKYCGKIGIEYMHIANFAERSWLQTNFENNDASKAVNDTQKKQILNKLIEAEGFEQFLDAKYKGAKRFGLDGGESLMPALDQTINLAAKDGVQEIVFGMAHRGRLNVLAHILGKPHRAIFHEFMGGSYKPDDVAGSGDVKYHLGASKDQEIAGQAVHLSLLPNPSHLEIVDPVVLGKARAKQDELLASTKAVNDVLQLRAKVLPILLHGDAAFAGQGIVQEILAASSLEGYGVAGSLHIIINNQVGFTTDPKCSRSSPYASDIAKMIDAPILHVNGDDPEAVVFACQLALQYRQTFHKPAVVDMYCYRRFGHNEGDEPSFTQPIMYKAIKSHKPIVQIYSEKLAISAQELDSLKTNWRQKLEEEFTAGAQYKPASADWLAGEWTKLKQASSEAASSKTSVPLEMLKEIASKLVTIPAEFNLHKTIARFIEQRSKMLETGEGLDWAMAEALAFGSLLCEGFPVRLSGEDVERGTFSQRHSVVYDQVNNISYTPLNHLQENQAKYDVVNSLLSEEGVLGFEYGYSLAQPNSLVLWEAQFGDFANGAQVVFDQFIASAETKWLRMSGLVCLLPHGFEGQGPEHSSARLERFLQSCAEDNMQVANCTTPANYFHILRRQLKRDFRKPLIMMTPKSLLRHKRAQSSFAELAQDSGFKRILPDTASLQNDAKIRRVILCSGKVYYDLYEEREKRGIDDIYIIRLEQLYPLPATELAQELSRFSSAQMIWCQEEPKNMGAWSFIEPHLEATLISINAKYTRARYVGRPAAASPSVGLMSEHLKQLAAFLEDALGQ
ncbi:MAG: 2-oxoglutarate dehydrogenase E1 component [Alphaproteobacteria bacterium]|nr:2-oxoglutarate dehydrogenase E1 component [Alphaproteobacteria bacterium]